MALRLGGALVATALLTGGALVAVPGRAVADPPSGGDPTFGAGTTHGRGHKVIYPTSDAWRTRRPAGFASSTTPLAYGGGVDGIGVTTGAPHVYIVFWGQQWGTSSTGSDGYLHLTGDSQAMVPRVQALISGLGTNGEIWSGVMTQYCEGVATGSTSCPSGAAHVGYPTVDALAGVWLDASTVAPSQATQSQLAAEAVAAAGHFGNTTAASNRNAQYLVVSPTGTHPDGFNTVTGNFCAWHDYTPSSDGDVAYTNLPYIPDMGTSCGMSYVNGGSAGTLDGVTIVEGHEYAETITDQNPAGGWLDSSGAENGDKCAWQGVGGTGGARDVTFATGSFAMQATWSNDSSGCAISHPIVTGVTGGGSVFNGGFEAGNLSGWTASGAPSGVSSTAHSGSWAAMLGATSATNGDSSISQTFPVPAGSTTLSLWYQIHCPDTVQYDWATATLHDNTANTTTTILPKTCPTNVIHWVQVQSAVTAGHSYTLTLTSHDDNYPGDPTYTLYDDVTTH
jgi:hypothetical protein